MSGAASGLVMAALAVVAGSFDHTPVFMSFEPLAAGWGLFHIAFGWQLLLTLAPFLFILSYVVQKTKNSWVGVILHGGLNGPSFLAIALGLL